MQFATPISTNIKGIHKKKFWKFLKISEKNQFRLSNLDLTKKYEYLQIQRVLIEKKILKISENVLKILKFFENFWKKSITALKFIINQKVHI
jgi:hypothetical protein